MSPSPSAAVEAAVPVPGATLSTVTQGAGTPVVLCHGGPGLCDNLGPLAALLTDSALVHRYDQRGNGGSSSDGPFDVATSVADLEALRRHWGHEHWVVGGHSWGAALALFYALAHPERTLGVVYLSGTGLHWGWQRATRARRTGRLTAAERQELHVLEDRMRAGASRDGDHQRFHRLMWSTDFVRRETADRVLDAAPLYPCARRADVFDAIAADQRRILDGGFAEAARALASPLVSIHGEGDAGLARAREVSELSPHGRLVVIPAAGHSPWLENPDAVRAAVVGFVEGL
jgi:proline iminopeptidase